MVALSIESFGHEVKGYDVDHRIAMYLAGKKLPYQEEHADELLATTKMEMVELKELCQWAEILFLAPQTPHQAKYEGHLPLPQSREDFDYSYLRTCVAAVDASLDRPKACVIISTVLPGTIEREVLPLTGEKFLLVYQPLFIAMGTVYEDFTHPEFVLAGCHAGHVYWPLHHLHRSIHQAPMLVTDIRTAEAIKVFYNTFITAKTVLANLYGEMSHKMGLNVDDIFRAISLSTDRLLSPKYLQAGMGDGGGCHPRDNIALSWLARECGLSYNFFEALMTAREFHADWLAELIDNEKDAHDLPVFILGRAFKPETNIETGSPSLLVSALLHRRGVAHSIEDDLPMNVAGIYFIGTKNGRYARYKFPAGSIVIDPFRYIPEREGVRIVAVGRATVSEKVSA